MPDKRNQPANQLEDSKMAVRQRIINHAVEVFGNRDKAMSWLERPSIPDGSGKLQSRLSMVDSAQGFRELEEWLVQIEHGIYR